MPMQNHYAPFFEFVAMTPDELTEAMGGPADLGMLGRPHPTRPGYEVYALNTGDRPVTLEGGRIRVEVEYRRPDDWTC